MLSSRISLYAGALLLLVTIGCQAESFQICSFDDAENVVQQWNVLSHSGDGAHSLLETGQEIFRMLGFD